MNSVLRSGLHALTAAILGDDDYGQGISDDCCGLFSLPAAAPAAPLGGGVAGRGVDPLPLPRPGVWPEAGAGLHCSASTWRRPAQETGEGGVQGRGSDQGTASLN